jgi:hypothetical protein
MSNVDVIKPPAGHTGGHYVVGLNLIEPQNDEVDAFDYDDVIDRAELPDGYMPSVKGALIASQQTVRRATKNCPPISRYRKWRYFKHWSSCDKRWVELDWIRVEPNWKLYVWRHGKVWFVQRGFCSARRPCRQGLAFLFGPSAVCAETCEAAKRLAEYYHLTPTEAAGGVLWIGVNE